MKVITLLQPWAGLWALGIKQNETRSFNTHYRGRLYIHSSAAMRREYQELLVRFANVLQLSQQQVALCKVRGAILGHVDIVGTYSTDTDTQAMQEVGIIEAMLGDYSPGRYFWKAEKPILLETPVPAKGQLGFWKWDGALPEVPQLTISL